MNIFSDILFLFVYIVTLMYFEMPNVNNNDYPIHKLYLFISIFGYYFVTQLIKKIKNDCHVDPYAITQDSLMMGLLCVLGYSIYVDLIYWDYTRQSLAFVKKDTGIIKFAVIALVIITFVTSIQLSKILFNGMDDECGADKQFLSLN